MRLSHIQECALRVLYPDGGDKYTYGTQGSMSVKASQRNGLRSFIEGTTVRALLRREMVFWEGTKIVLTEKGAKTSRHLLGLETSLERAGNIIAEVLNEG